MDPYVPDPELLFIVHMMGGIVMCLVALVFTVSMAKVLYWFISRRD